MAGAGTIGAANLYNRAMTSDYLQNGMSQGIQNAATKLVNSKAIPSVLRAGQGSQSAEAPYDPSSDPALQGMMNGYDPDQDQELQNMLQGAQGYDHENDPELQQLIQGTSSETINREAAPLNAPMLTPRAGLQDRIRQAESGGNPNAKNPNSSASGPYQFTDSTWAGMVRNYPETGLTVADKGKPEAQEIMAQLLTQENTQAYNAKGIEPNEADLYAAHFLGGPAAVKAKQNPQAYGAELFPAAAKSNPTIFYNNGRPRTNAEINRLLGEKIGAM